MDKTKRRSGFVNSFSERCTESRTEARIGYTSTHFWRPWITATDDKQQKNTLFKPYDRASGGLPADTHSRSGLTSHPAKLFWPRSRCYDYLYRDAEILLRNHPLQATICLYEDSSSDEVDSDEQYEKECN